MFGTKRTDVIVAGAGPTGLVTALGLAKRGVEVYLLDEGWRPAANSYALALHADSLERLDDLGLAGDLAAKGRKIERVAIYEGSRRLSEVDLTGLSERFPFVLVQPQRVLENLLADALVAGGAEVHWNHRLKELAPDGERTRAVADRLEKVSAGYASATTEWVVGGSPKFSARFVIGADGIRSTVRRFLPTEFEKVGETELYAVFEIETDFDPGTEVRLVRHREGCDVLWPLPGNACRFSFRVSGDAAKPVEREKARVGLEVAGRSYPRFSRERLESLLAERAPWFDGEIRDLRWALAIPFERRLARSFGSGNLWLAGDAGHSTSPVGMQSMNVGLREGEDLAGAVAEALVGNREALPEYAEARRREWRSLLGLEGGPFADPLAPLLPATGKGLEALLAALDE